MSCGCGVNNEKGDHSNIEDIFISIILLLSCNLALMYCNCSY